MNAIHLAFTSADGEDGDRRQIRLDGPCPQAGIAAALRRAFENPVAANDSIEDEFDLLLASLH